MDSVEKKVLNNYIFSNNEIAFNMAKWKKSRLLFRNFHKKFCKFIEKA
jgi:hypothetical protein